MIKKVETIEYINIRPIDTFMIFFGTNFCIYNLCTKKWDIGYLVGDALDFPVP